MNPSQDPCDLIENVLKESRLPARQRDEVRKELESHVWETGSELKERGLAEEEIPAAVQARFGAPKEIGRLFSFVHGSFIMRFVKPGLIVLTALPFPFAVLPGFANVLTLFGVLFALPTSILLASAMFARRYGKIKAASILALTAVIGQWLSFLSWIASRRSIPAEEAAHRWPMDFPSDAKAGFPISALELPPSPLGNDHVPVEMWLGVFANQLIWFLIAVAVASYLPKKSAPTREKFIGYGILAFLAFIYTLATFTLWYD